MGIHPYTKTLVRARPIVRMDTNVVKTWMLAVKCDSTEKEWSMEFSDMVDVEYLNKTPDQFTREELINLVDVNDQVFDSHYETSEEQKPVYRPVADFDINSLS